VLFLSLLLPRDVLDPLLQVMLRSLQRYRPQLCVGHGQLRRGGAPEQRVCHELLHQFSGLPAWQGLIWVGAPCWRPGGARRRQVRPQQQVPDVHLHVCLHLWWRARAHIGGDVHVLRRAPQQVGHGWCEAWQPLGLCWLHWLHAVPHVLRGGPDCWGLVLSWRHAPGFGCHG
jgi:hypothetical protein